MTGERAMRPCVSAGMLVFHVPFIDEGDVCDIVLGVVDQMHGDDMAIVVGTHDDSGRPYRVCLHTDDLIPAIEAASVLREAFPSRRRAVEDAKTAVIRAMRLGTEVKFLLTTDGAPDWITMAAGLGPASNLSTPADPAPVFVELAEDPPESRPKGWRPK